MAPRRLDRTIIYLLVLILSLHLLIYWQYSTRFPSPSTASPATTLIRSNIAMNSFNPGHIHFSLHPHLTSFHRLFIIDNNAPLLELSHPPSSTSLMALNLSDGFHHLQILLVLLGVQPSSGRFYEEIDLSVGSRSLLVAVLDEEHRPMENISVHLELVEYSHISRELRTNRAGEVLFDHLPGNSQVYVEAACVKTNRQAFVEVNTDHYRNMTLLLGKTSAWHYDEYDPADRGYYAIWQNTSPNCRNLSSYRFLSQWIGRESLVLDTPSPQRLNNVPVRNWDQYIWFVMYGVIVGGLLSYMIVKLLWWAIHIFIELLTDRCFDRQSMILMETFFHSSGIPLTLFPSNRELLRSCSFV